MASLFLDDDKNRTDQIIKKFADIDEELVLTSTAKDAIEKLSSKSSWNYVFLDHDLGGEVFVDSGREDCGMEVVRWCLINKPQIDHIIVHTWNAPAGERMTEELKTAGYDAIYKPFGMW